ncbi:MAG: TetR family transcriptional regulator [Reyranellaceae bacterium]
MSAQSAVEAKSARKPARRSRREEYSDATRRALLKAARELFASQGYQATSIDAVVRRARVTKGALYHHFADKRALFDAVVVALQQEMTATVDRKAAAERERWTRLKLGIAAFLDACAEPAYRRLVIQDAPAVLGMARFREIDDQALDSFRRAIALLQERGEIEYADAALLTRLLAALVWETAMLLAESDDPARLRGEALAAIDRIVDGFRRR